MRADCGGRRLSARAGIRRSPSTLHRRLRPVVMEVPQHVQRAVGRVLHELERVERVPHVPAFRTVPVGVPSCSLDDALVQLHVRTLNGGFIAPATALIVASTRCSPC